MTNDQFKLLVYGTALLGVAYIGGNGWLSEKHSNFSDRSYPQAPYEWSQGTSQHFKQQDSPWLWLESRKPARQVAQAIPKKEDHVLGDAPKSQVRSVREEDQISTEIISPTSGVEEMEKLRQFRLEQQNERVTIIRM